MTIYPTPPPGSIEIPTVNKDGSTTFQSTQMSESNIKDGGPAFPSDRACDSWQCRKPSAGMNLRDYFAAAALQGLLSGHANPGNWQDFAADSYRYADAMLERRKR